MRIGDKVRVGCRVGVVACFGSGPLLGSVAVRFEGRKLVSWVRTHGLEVVEERPAPRYTLTIGPGYDWSNQ